MLTLSVRSFQTPPTPFTCAWPPSLPSEPTSLATRVTSPANELSWSTMVLMVDFSSSISPFTSTVIFFDRSPLATAVVTSAMLRTWPVRLAAMRLTLSVRSFQVPATPLTLAWPPSLPSEPTSRATRVTSRGEGAELAHHGVHDLADAQELAPQRAALDLELHGLAEVALGDGADDAGDLDGRLDEVADHGVHRIDAFAPAAARGRQLAALADLAFLADHLGDAGRALGSRPWFSSAMSLNASAISPSMPVRSRGRRTEKSPFRNARNVLRSSLESSGAAMVAVSGI